MCCFFESLFLGDGLLFLLSSVQVVGFMLVEV